MCEKCLVVEPTSGRAVENRLWRWLANLGPAWRLGALQLFVYKVDFFDGKLHLPDKMWRHGLVAVVTKSRPS